jgi:hypothetical protein
MAVAGSCGFSLHTHPHTLTACVASIIPWSLTYAHALLPPLLSLLLLLAATQRNIMADHPRVTKFPHDFDNEPEQMPEQQEPEDMADEDLLGDNDNDESDEEEEEDDELSGDGDEAVDVDVENVQPQGNNRGFGFNAATGFTGFAVQGKQMLPQQQMQQQQAADMDTDMQMG